MFLTVVMYHYVRRIAESRYPEIKGLERDLFAEQLKYIRRFYEPVTVSQVIAAINGNYVLPSNAILLTFDDGYLDHFINVFPLLMREKISGVFFPPVRCVMERKILDVNKIHYILASAPDKSKIVKIIDNSIKDRRGEFGLDSLKFYRDKYAIANRFDSADVIYIKRMLQVGLPDELRSYIATELFSQFVSADERSFANDLYMDEDQVRCLHDAGMIVGSHGYNHEWLDSLSPAEQIKEIDLSLSFLKNVGVSDVDWVMCYPYGAWNHSLLDILRSRGCGLGFTTDVSIANLSKNDKLLLPRLDTNDLPKSATADPSSWTSSVISINVSS